MPRPVRSSELAIWVATALLAGVASAAAAVMVLGNTKAHECYLAAKTGIEVRAGIKLCDEALDEGEMVARDVAATYVNRGVLYDIVGRYEDALADFNKSITFNPDLGDGYLNRGVSLIRLKRLDEALADVQKGMALGVSVPEIGYYDLAVVQEDMGRITEAYYNYKHALDIAPGYAPASEALKHFTVIRRPKPPQDMPSGGT